MRPSGPEVFALSATKSDAASASYIAGCGVFPFRRIDERHELDVALDATEAVEQLIGVATDAGVAVARAKRDQLRIDRDPHHALPAIRQPAVRHP